MLYLLMWHRYMDCIAASSLFFCGLYFLLQSTHPLVIYLLLWDCDFMLQYVLGTMAVICLMIQNLVDKYVPETNIVLPMLNDSAVSNAITNSSLNQYFVLSKDAGPSFK